MTHPLCYGPPPLVLFDQSLIKIASVLRFSITSRLKASCDVKAIKGNYTLVLNVTFTVFLQVAVFYVLYRLRIIKLP